MRDLSPLNLCYRSHVRNDSSLFSPFKHIKTGLALIPSDYCYLKTAKEFDTRVYVLKHTG